MVRVGEGYTTQRRRPFHQRRRIEVQQQTDVDAAPANGRVSPRVKRPTGTSPVAGSSTAFPRNDSYQEESGFSRR